MPVNHTVSAKKLALTFSGEKNQELAQKIKMIRTESISKIYRSKEVETIALNQVSINIESGEFLSVMGPSGCGKTTLLNVLGLLDVPSQGAYFFQGKNMVELNEKARSEIRRKEIGFVFQSFNLIEELTVYENIELPLIYLDKPRKERRALVEQVMDRMKMSHRHKHFPSQLSGGQQQRVAVARALVNSPSVILADEPTGNLDSKQGNEVMDLLAQLNEQGTTIVMVTHSAHDAAFSSRIIRLLDGELLSENRTSQNELVW